MPIKKELCRNFQRGSCQYGERCKFAHATQQQPKSNAFGFGANSTSFQQQKPNPFGFGVQNNSQSNVATDFGSKPTHFKPFENKWTRPTSSRQSENQAQSTNHKCTDPESCRRIILEDFQNERPLWRLTCYGHWKNFPCDMVGDVSFEELRAAAYDDAKRGLSLQSVVERERNLVNSKLIEFENLCKNGTVLPNSTPSTQNLFPGTTPNAFAQGAQNSVPPSVSSFSQLGTSLNIRPTGSPNNSYGQVNPPAQSVNAFSQLNPAATSNNAFAAPSIHASGQLSAPAPSNNGFGFGQLNSPAPSNNAFGFGQLNPPAPSNNAFGFGQLNPPAPSNNAFGQLTSTSSSNNSFGQLNSFPSQTSSAFGANNMPSGSFGSQFPTTSSISGFRTSGAVRAENNPFSTLAVSAQVSEATNKPSTALHTGLSPSSSGTGQATKEVTTVNDMHSVFGDAIIWLKDKWNPGEIPEEAPPDAFIN